MLIIALIIAGFLANRLLGILDNKIHSDLKLSGGDLIGCIPSRLGSIGNKENFKNTSMKNSFLDQNLTINTHQEDSVKTSALELFKGLVYKKF